MKRHCYARNDGLRTQSVVRTAMSIAIISHPHCELHNAGEYHPEQPARFKVIQAALESYHFKAPVCFLTAPLATHDDLLRAHELDYVDWIFSIAPQEGSISIDADTVMNAHTLGAALRAAGAVMMAVDQVMTNAVQVAFCNIRPPGHHAEPTKAMGFCFFNNVALGVQYAKAVYGLKRIAIIDFDVHHGNGTQAIFQNDPSVLLCSSFEHPLYPGYDSEMDNDHLLALPLPAGTGGQDFRSKVEAAWFAKLAAFQPEMIFFSAGFDGHQDDPLANLSLTKSDYVWLTTHIATIARRYCHGRMISVLEGGYHLPALAECVPAHVEAMIVSS